jgi:Xaa-Pro aminopeptidase
MRSIDYSMTISLKERDRRYQAIKELIRENNLDCLLIIGRDSNTTRGNLRYVSNYGVNFGEQYCLFPADGDPVFLGSLISSAHVRRAGWIHDCIETSDISHQIIREISRRSRSNAVGLVGMQYMSAPLYLSIAEAFPGKIVDAVSIFRQLRLVKSPEEIEKIKTSVAIADEAYTVIRGMLKPGLTDYEIYGEAKRVIHCSGCEYSMEFIDAEAAKMNVFHPVGNVLTADSTLVLELTPAYEGYYAQLTVTIPVSKYPPHIEPLLTVWRTALEAGVDRLKPGTKVSDIQRLVSEIAREHGYVSPLRAGHGIGLDALEFFSFSENEDTELVSGMTVVFHPCVAIEAGGDGIGMGYTYLITDNGAEKLNKIVL